jgi:hypothetical protein
MSSESRHTVPGQAAGLYYQIERALARLATIPVDAAVGVEKEDDVSVAFKGGMLWLEQDKHTINDRRPYGDRSSDLWKTLDTWLAAASDGQIDPVNSRFFLVTNVNLENGLARMLAGADSPEQIEACIKCMASIAPKLPDSVKEFGARVLKHDRTTLDAVIRNIECLDASCASSGDDLRRQVASALHVPSDVDSEDILTNLHGWVAEEILRCWRQKEAAIIHRGVFDRQFHRILRKLQRYKQLGLPEHLVHIPREERDKYKNHRYVRQMRLVRASADEILEGIDDYMRSSIERFRLAKEGDVSRDDWVDFDGTLADKWRAIFRRETRLSGERSEENIGYRIMSDTLACDANLADSPTYPYMIKGTYHRLTDDATQGVGWHPRFTELL